jgi:subfamily B ATP-binding cassette protein MsbA
LISIYVRILDPANNLLRKYDEFKRSEGTAQRFLDILTSTPSVVEDTAPDLTPTWDGNDAVRFEKVYFKYEEADESVLRDCSFKVPMNATTMVLGRSGAGKSTISKIILGFWPVTEGKVFIHGRSLGSWNPEELRERMSYVSQGDHIVDESVRENLLWGYSKKGVIEEADMVQALREVRIPIESLDRSARELSLGQQQRLSFARMLLDESDIVILDEPFSGVDVFTISELRNCLIEEFTAHRRTVLMFSHRLALSAYADHIVILGDHEAIAEEGSPKQLIELGGEFARLHKSALEELTLATFS